MNCPHDYVITFRTEDGQPAMWACSDCKLKFVSFSQMLAEVAEEREACAKDCETLLPSQRIYDRRFYDAVGECVLTIRARGEK